MGITLLYATCSAGGTGCVTDIGSDGAPFRREYRSVVAPVAVTGTVSVVASVAPDDVCADLRPALVGILTPKTYTSTCTADPGSSVRSLHQLVYYSVHPASAMRINENNCLGSIGSTVRKTVRTPPAVGPSGLTFAA